MTLRLKSAGMLLFVAGACVGPASAACDPNGLAERFSAAVAAVSQWEASNGTRLSQAARQSLLLELCTAVDAADAAASSPGVNPNRMSEATKVAVVDYLTREITPTMQARTISASLRSALGASGFSRPSTRKLGTLEIKSASPKVGVRVVQGSVGEDLEFEKPPVKVMLPPGMVRVFKLPAPKDKPATACSPPEVKIQAGTSDPTTC